MYIVTTAARISSSVLVSEPRKACAAPWKLERTLCGIWMSRSAVSIAFTASPSDFPGARLKEIVVDGNWPRWLMARAPGRSVTFATAESGICAAPPSCVEPAGSDTPLDDCDPGDAAPAPP